MGDIKNIAKHVAILNKEMGIVHNDISWLKKVQAWQTALLTGIFVTLLTVGIKYIMF